MGEGASVGLGVIVGEGGNEVAVRGRTSGRCEPFDKLRINSAKNLRHGVRDPSLSLRVTCYRERSFKVREVSYSITNYFIIKILRLLHIPPILRPRGNDFPIQACGLLPQAFCLIDLL